MSEEIAASAEDAQVDGPADYPSEVSVEFDRLAPNQQIYMEEALNADLERIVGWWSDRSAKFMDDDGNRVRSGHFTRALVYATLKDDYPDITLHEAGRIPLDMSQMAEQDETEGSDASA